MKVPIGVALIICGTALMMLPFAYELVFLSQEAYVIAHDPDAGPPPGSLQAKAWQPHQYRIFIGGLVMVLGGVAGTFFGGPSKPKKVGPKAKVAVNGAVFLQREEGE